VCQWCVEAIKDSNNLHFRPKTSDFEVRQRKIQRTPRILTLGPPPSTL